MFIIYSLKLTRNIWEYSRERANTNMREKMRNQNLGKYFNGDTAVLTWEISGAIQLPLEGQPRGLFSSLEEAPHHPPPGHISFFSQSLIPVSFKQTYLCVYIKYSLWVWHCYKQWKCSNDIKQKYLPSFRLHSSGWRWTISKISMQDI